MDSKEPKISITVILTIIPFVGYFLAFVFEYGYSEYFCIPYQYISINIETILLLTFFLLLIGQAIYFQIDALSPVLKHLFKKSSFNRYILIRLPFWTVFALIMILKDASLFAWILFAVAIYIFFIARLIFPFFRRNKKISYMEYFDKDIKSEISEDSFTNKLFEKYNPNIIVLLILFMTFVFILYQVGGAWAQNKMEFKIINSDSSQVVVNIYGDNLFLCRIDEVKKRKIKHIEIINSAILKNFELSKYILHRVSDGDVNNTNSQDSSKIGEIDTMKSLSQ